VDKGGGIHGGPGGVLAVRQIVIVIIMVIDHDCEDRPVGNRFGTPPFPPVLRGEGSGVRGRNLQWPDAPNPHPRPPSPDYRGEGNHERFGHTPMVGPGSFSHISLSPTPSRPRQSSAAGTDIASIWTWSAATMCSVPTRALGTPGTNTT